MNRARTSSQAHTELGVGWWIAASVAVAAVLSGATLATFGAGEHGLDTALMLTGRWAFLLFWPAYAGAGMVMLLGDRFNWLKRNGRNFGLAFASSMLVHSVLIGWLCAIGAAPATSVFVFFGIGLFCIYTLALFSISGLQRRIGSRSWWPMRLVGMNYIAYAFATDFLRDPLSSRLEHIVLYVPFALLSILGFAAYASTQVPMLRKTLAAIENY